MCSVLTIRSNMVIKQIWSRNRELFLKGTPQPYNQINTVAIPSFDQLQQCSTHRKFLCPLFCKFIVLRSIGLVYSGNFRDQWIIWIWVCQKRTDRQQNWNGQKKHKFCFAWMNSIYWLSKKYWRKLSTNANDTMKNKRYNEKQKIQWKTKDKTKNRDSFNPQSNEI